MPYLTNGANGRYINAVYVDGYREKKQWISTQLPLDNTVADFWQLLLENQTNIIIQLETSPTIFYPAKRAAPLKVGPFIITREKSISGDAAEIIHLDVRSDQGCMQVQVLVPNKWMSESLPLTDVIISLQEATLKLQQGMACSRMCVTCLDGSTKCGIYICAYNAIEKLNTEQMVDVYTSTVLAKLRRPQFISTIEQYGYLYQVLQDYIRDFGEYSNFR
ncbi:receptor-type tyrosine-protein phosphatase epsilon-like [Watersipora subatra]|uniref:receptor-type tyrosine-protein phosphatase epsilon-like n=1 Tax=Watersipora subatra TaxID=2589382 RepID=UPI00355C3A4B